MNYDQICHEVINNLDSLGRVLSDIPDSPENERASDLRRDLESGFYSIVVVGEFNRGKSTILNALLAQELLPMDILPATAAIHMLRFSREPVLRAHWRDDRVEDMALSAETLKRFASVESADALTYLEIGVPAPILASGVVFIDTPGVDDMNVSFRQRCVRRSAAIRIVCYRTL
jgi:predicted GTPase